MERKGQSQRCRPLIKSVAFSEVEWESVERRMLLFGSSSFSDLARSSILESKIIVRQKSPLDSHELGVELNRIGNNINQIARLVNTEKVTTLEEMRATRYLVQQIQILIERAIKESG